MAQRFGSQINFLTVYILEAHATDTWPIGSDIQYKQTHSLEERMVPCNAFITKEEYDFPVRIDAPPDAFNTLFAAWPLRFYVLDSDATMLYIGEPDGSYIFVDSLTDWLGDYLSTPSSN